jgi:RNA-directed DNA polymerase
MLWVKDSMYSPVLMSQLTLFLYKIQHMSREHFKVWGHITWRPVRLRVFKMQRRIYKASRNGERTKVHSLQRRLVHGIDARLLAVSNITTTRGRNTPGVDQESALSAEEKMALANGLKLDGKASPIRRVYIPKAGSRTKRPLGIPTMEDRAKQALAKLALEPQHEAHFEPSSYGFRPGRCAQDAIETVWHSLARARGEKYVLDADIAKCFDTIDHQALLDKLQTYPAMEKQIKAWLKAGIMTTMPSPGHMSQPILPNPQGTPQGGVISPLLANIALHGLEYHLQKAVPKSCINGQFGKVNLIRYADDFLILHTNLQVLQRCYHIAEDYLNNLKLKLNPEKTRLVRASQGFDYLGFRLIKVRKHGQLRTRITPSKANMVRHSAELRRIIRSNRSASAFAMIQQLRPVITGWCNYYRYCECSESFKKLRHLTYLKLRAWMWRRDKRARTKVKESLMPSGNSYLYEDTVHQDNWTLVGRTKSKKGVMVNNYLPSHTWTHSKKFVKVRGCKSPYDGDTIYWLKRTANDVYHNARLGKLIHRQNGLCPHCKTPFLTSEENPPEIDHITPQSLGGSDRYKNLQALHRVCHREKSSREKSSTG